MKMKDGTIGVADFSSDGTYRYSLSRVWTPRLVEAPLAGGCMFVMLNPSTADADTDDRTIGRCVAFAQGWGYDSLTVCNLFALMSTDPAHLYLHTDPIGPLNDDRIVVCAERAAIVVCAWGNHGTLHSRSARVLDLLRARHDTVYCLAMNKSGEPKHPLYMPSNLEPTPLR